MGKIEDITVGLPIELIDEIRRSVRNGQFASESEAVLEAVRAWLEARDLFGGHEPELGALWDDGVASGPGRFSGIDDLVVEAESRARRGAG